MPDKTIDFDAPIRGRIYLVEAYQYVSFGDGPAPRLFLVGISIEMKGVGMCGYEPSRFRRIVPACDRNAQQKDELIPHEGFFEGRPDLT